MKGIKAKVTIIDDENGLVLVEDKLIAPYREYINSDLPVTDYEFRFRFKHMDYSRQLFESVEYVQDFFDRIEKEIKDGQSNNS